MSHSKTTSIKQDPIALLFIFAFLGFLVFGYINTHTVSVTTAEPQISAIREVK